MPSVVVCGFGFIWFLSSDRWACWLGFLWGWYNMVSGWCRLNLGYLADFLGRFYLVSGAWVGARASGLGGCV